MPVAVANPLISSPYGAGRVSARGPYSKKKYLVTLVGLSYFNKTFLNLTDHTVSISQKNKSNKFDKVLIINCLFLSSNQGVIAGK